MSISNYYLQIAFFSFVFFVFCLQDVLNYLGSSELDEDDLMLDLDLSDDQRHRHGNSNVFTKENPRLNSDVFMDIAWVKNRKDTERAHFSTLNFIKQTCVHIFMQWYLLNYYLNTEGVKVKCIIQHYPQLGQILGLLVFQFLLYFSKIIQ